MSLASMPIRRLVPTMIAVISVGAVVVGGLAIWQTRSARASERSLDSYLTATQQINRFALLDAQAKLDSTVIRAYPQTAPVQRKLLTAEAAEMGTDIAALDRAPLSSSEHASVNAVQAARNAFNAIDAKEVDLNTPQKIAAANQLYDAAATKQTEAIAVSVRLLQRGVTRKKIQLHDAIRNLTYLLLVVVIGVSLLLAGGLSLFGRRLIRRIDLLDKALGNVVAGDLRMRVDAHGDDEVAHMAAGINTLTARLSSVFSSIDQASTRLRGSAASLQSVADQVAQSAAQASSQAEVVARTADEVSQNVQAVSAGGEEMGSSIEEISRNANEAARVATAAVNSVEVTTQTMSKLGDSSREIGDVVRLITSIAEQTNLLALNATIEAARAGDAGKGFAVVADEVKQLAQETARATEDISRRVETIQVDAADAAQAISAVAGVITRINEFQTTIASAVEEQTTTTQAINGGVSHAATGSAQIARSISGIAEASSLTASSMNQARSNAAELAATSEDLAAIVAGFKY